MPYSARLEILDGVEVVRRRPFLFIERPTPAAFLDAAIKNLFADSSPPTAVRITVWREPAITIAFDSTPLPIVRDGEGIPEIYHLFLSVSTHRRPSRAFGGGILNALSERLVVSTMHGDLRHRCAFARGGLVAFLAHSRVAERFGTNWFTLQPDPTILSGQLTYDEVRSIASSITAPAPIEVIDRRSELALWW